MRDNPFSLLFGKEPERNISRHSQMSEILEAFKSEKPSTQVYIITGVRGAGKTVMLSSIYNQLKADEDWITVSLNPNRDMLQGLAAYLCEEPMLKAAFLKAEINLSFLGIGTSVKNEAPTDAEVQLKKMFEIIRKLNKRVLITIDEVVNSEYVRVFVSTFQNFIREDLPMYLLMTGLFENVRNLQNHDALTFLYRTPRIELKPLGIKSMANHYRDVFDIASAEAEEMARFTRGYSYGFQVLGYLRYETKKELPDLVDLFDEYMEDYVYEKIWSELSSKDREVIKALAENGKMRVKEIQAATGLTSSSFSTYRKRLKQIGLISVEDYGYCELTLPRFGEIVSAW